MHVVDPDIEIPDQSGVMLLGGAPLFPNCAMGLHIFEPRYRKMLNDALEKDWMFCIGNLTSEEGISPENCTAKVGTIATINESRTLDDGRSVLVISGLHPVKFESWNANLEYPCAEISLLDRIAVPVVEEVAVKTLLLDALPAAMEEFSGELKGAVMTKINTFKSSSTMIDFMAHHFISDSDLRGELLQELDDRRRASQLIAALISP